MKTFFIVLLYLGNTIVQAQEWVSNYNKGLNDFSSKIVLDSQNNSYVIGTTQSNDSLNHILLIKYNSSGNRQWFYVFENSLVLNSHGGGVAVDSDGNSYISGNFQTIDSTNGILLARISTAGSAEWIRYYQNDNEIIGFGGLKRDVSGDIYILGDHFNINTFASGVLVVKYTSSGDSVWTNRRDSITPTNFNIDDFGNSYVTGTIFNSSSLFDCITYKVGENGNLIWSRLFGGFQSEFGNSIVASITGDVYVTGNDISDEADIFLLKYDPDGRIIWNRTYNSPENYRDVGRDVNIDNSDNIYVAGISAKSDGLGSRILLLKYNSSGDTLWEETYNYNGRSTSFADVHVDGLGNTFLTGYGQRTVDSISCITLRYNSSGMLEWSSEFGNHNETGTSIAIDGHKNIFVGGSLIGDNGSNEIFALRYNDPTYIISTSAEIPASFSLEQNYPNPFNPETSISFSITKSASVKLVVFDMLGREVRTLLNNIMNAGEYKYIFNAEGLNSGIYFYKIEINPVSFTSGNFSQTRKMNFIK